MTIYNHKSKTTNKTDIIYMIQNEKTVTVKTTKMLKTTGQFN